MLFGILNYYTYIAVSIFFALFYVYDYSCVYSELYPTVVALTNSKAFNILAVNAVFCALLLSISTLRSIFFGSMTALEMNTIRDKMVIHVVETLVGMTYYKDSVNTTVSIITVLTAGFKMLHILASARADSLGIDNNASRFARMRQISFLTVAFAIDCIVVGHLVSLLMVESVPMYMLILVEYNQMLMAVLAVSVRMALIQLSSVWGRDGENVASAIFLMDMTFEILRSFQYILCFILLCYEAELPIHLARQLLANVHSGAHAIRNLFKYHRMAVRIDQRFPDAAAADLDRDRQCAICYDDMEDNAHCKRLPCGHCYHRSCLRRWFEKNSSCPYCRLELDRAQPDASTAAQGAGDEAHDQQNAPGGAHDAIVTSVSPLDRAALVQLSQEKQASWPASLEVIRELAKQIPAHEELGPDFNGEIALEMLVDLYNADGPLCEHPAHMLKNMEQVLRLWQSGELPDGTESENAEHAQSSANGDSTALAAWLAMGEIQRELRAEMHLPEDVRQAHLVEAELFLRFPKLASAMILELVRRMDAQLGDTWQPPKQLLRAFSLAVLDSMSDTSGGRAEAADGSAIAPTAPEDRSVHGPHNKYLPHVLAFRSMIGEEEGKLVCFTVFQMLVQDIVDDEHVEVERTTAPALETKGAVAPRIVAPRSPSNSINSMSLSSAASPLNFDVVQSETAVFEEEPLDANRAATESTATGSARNSATTRRTAPPENEQRGSQQHPQQHAKLSVQNPSPSPITTTATNNSTAGSNNTSSSNNAVAVGRRSGLTKNEIRTQALKQYEAEITAAAERLAKALYDAAIDGDAE